MKNTQLKVKQQAINYLNNHEETAEDLKRGEATVHTKTEYVEYVKSLENSFKGNEEVHAKWLKEFEEKDFDAIFISADNEIHFFKDGDF